MNILGLTDYHVLAIDEDEHDFHIQAKLIPSPSCCAHCGHPKLYRHEVKPQTDLDQPIRGKHVGIIIHRRRYKCCACHRSFFEPVPHMDEHHFMTHRLVSYIQQTALRRTFTSIADEVGLTEGTIRLLFSEFTAGIQPRFPETGVRYLGIDELYLLNQYRCVITDVEHHQIVELLRDRHKETVINYLQRLPDSMKEQITVVCTDLWAGYHDAVHRVLPHVHLVADKWHVLKLLHKCLETVRKEIRADLTDRQRRTLMHDRFLLLKRPNALDEHDTLILETWLKNFPRLETAYRLKEAFYSIYESQTEEEACQRYFTWLNQITPDVRDVFWPFVLTIEEYGDAIFAYFRYRVTAGYTESLNGLMKVLAHEGRGFSFEVIRAKVLLTNGLRKVDRPAYDKQWHHADVASHPASSDGISCQIESGIPARRSSTNLI